MQPPVAKRYFKVTQTEAVPLESLLRTPMLFWSRPSPSTLLYLSCPFAIHDAYTKIVRVIASFISALHKT